MNKRQLIELLGKLGDDTEPIYMDVQFSKPRISYTMPLRSISHDPDVGIALEFNENDDDSSEGQIIANAEEGIEEIPTGPFSGY